MTDLLKNLLRGAGTVLDLSPAPSHAQKMRSRPSDAELLFGDWRQVGNDIRVAAESFASEQSGTRIESVKTRKE